jgi:hypothetical protein
MKNITLNQVRVFTENDVYHYTVENRPVTDLASNDEILKTELERQSRVTTSDMGDADSSPVASGRITVFYNTPLTSARVVNLNITNPQDGDMVRVVRTTNATGASTLTIQGGGATHKILAVGQWTDYEFWGKGLNLWMETGFGSL